MTITAWSRRHGRIIVGARGDETIKFHIPVDKRFVRAELTNVRGRYRAGARIKKQPSRGDSGRNQELVVHWWFDGGGSIWSGSDNPYVAYTVKVYTEKVMKRAIIVAGENTGRFEIFNNLPPLAKRAAERVLDALAESFVERNAHVLFDDYYDKMKVLIDTDCTKAKIRQAIASLSRTHRVDLAFFGHGGATNGVATLELHGGATLEESDVRGWKTRDDFQGAKLGLVYMTHCHGSKFSDAWRHLGFKTSIGSVRNNYMPEPMFTLFWTYWREGATARSAAKRAWENSKAIMTGVYPPTVRLDTSTFPFRIVTRDNAKVSASKPVVSGSRNFKITSDV